MPQPRHPFRPRFGGEDGRQHRPSAGAGDGAAADGKDAGPGQGAPSNFAADAVLQFEPDRIVSAIVFHMLYEVLAREIAAVFFRNAVARLGRRAGRPSIRRSAWVAMSNHERLEWLLAESRTIPLLRDDDVVLLGSRDA